MRPIASLRTFFSAFFVIGAMCSLPSCFPCLDMDCGNGTCVSGTCECYDGYYGSECQYSYNAAGYDCISGSCTYVLTDGTYATYSDCDNSCGGGACQYEVFTGGGNCTDEGYFPVAPSLCCSPSYPYFCSETQMCYTSCESADAACSVATVTTGVANGGSAGYVCTGGSCNYVTSGASYSSLTQCQSACSGGGSAGYDCSGGNCSYVSSGADYVSLSACQSACASSGPATGRISVKIYYKPTGACQANNVDHTLRFYYHCAEGTSLNSVAAGIWTTGEDAGGLYRVCLFGNETAALCVHGSTLYNRVYRLEWEVTPDLTSYPNSCILSGATNIDFQDQIKNVVISY
ncbi:MAG: hypothetical protein K9J06_01650 [Flavobacteriales bacterium]|nr:hypothetical protein [Flavobacteriales bacterium]